VLSLTTHVFKAVYRKTNAFNVQKKEKEMGTQVQAATPRVPAYALTTAHPRVCVHPPLSRTHTSSPLSLSHPTRRRMRRWRPRPRRRTRTGRPRSPAPPSRRRRRRRGGGRTRPHTHPVARGRRCSTHTTRTAAVITTTRRLCVGVCAVVAVSVDDVVVGGGGGVCARGQSPARTVLKSPLARANNHRRDQRCEIGAECTRLLARTGLCACLVQVGVKGGLELGRKADAALPYRRAVRLQEGKGAERQEAQQISAEAGEDGSRQIATSPRPPPSTSSDDFHRQKPLTPSPPRHRRSACPPDKSSLL